MNALLRFRRRHLLTQEDAAKVVGIAGSTWRQLEVGYRGREPSPALLLHLAALDRLAESSRDRFAENNLEWPTLKELSHGDDDTRGP